MESSGLLQPSVLAREIAGGLLHPPSRALAPLWAWYRVMTAALLPPRIRQGFGLGFDPVRDRAVFRPSLGALRIMRHLPARLRYLPPYLAAQRRLSGEAEDGFVRLLNRIVLGTPLRDARERATLRPQRAARRPGRPDGPRARVPPSR
jgi:hypothetical protein